MKTKYILPLAFSVVFPCITTAQVEERTRPVEWNNLVAGGRHMDRFGAMAPSRVARANWGTEAVRNRYVDNGIEQDDISFWGGNILKDKDGLYHMYVCGWPENSPKGHMFWSNSTVFHATSQHLGGPYKVQNSIGKGHNPEAYLLEDGRILVYTIDGYYIADNPEGPWMFGKFEFDTRGHKIIEGLSNLTFCRRQDGTPEPWFKYERAKVFQDEEGRVVQMNFAVIDTLKNEDLPGDRHSSKNICIQMNKGLLLEVLNTDPINAQTRRVELRIKGEKISTLQPRWM